MSFQERVVASRDRIPAREVEIRDKWISQSDSLLAIMAISMAELRFVRFGAHRAMGGRGVAIRLLEVPDEMADTGDAASRRDLFDAQKRGLQEILRPFHAQIAQVAHERFSGFLLEQVTQPRRRELHGFRQLLDREFAMELLIHEVDHGAHSWVHVTMGAGFHAAG